MAVCGQFNPPTPLVTRLIIPSHASAECLLAFCQARALMGRVAELRVMRTRLPPACP